MVEIVRRNISVTVTSIATAVKTDFIDKKHLIVEAQQTNTKKVYVGLSYDLFTGRRQTDFDTLDPQQVKFYTAPKGKSIAYVWYYCESGTQLLDLIASDGSITYLNDRTIEKEFPYDHDFGIAITPAAGDTSKAGSYQPSTTEKVLLRGVIFSTVTYLADDRVKLTFSDSAWTLKQNILQYFYVPCEKMPHVIMLAKPIAMAIGDQLSFSWEGTASAGRKIYIAFLLSRKTPDTS